MARLIDLGDGVVHEFPDDATDDEIRRALDGGGAPAAMPTEARRSASGMVSPTELRNRQDTRQGEYIGGLLGAQAGAAIAGRDPAQFAEQYRLENLAPETPGDRAAGFGRSLGRGATLGLAFDGPDEFAQRHPVANAVGTAAGAALPILGLSRLPGGQHLLGMRGPLIARSIMGGTSGAALTGVPAAIKGEDPLGPETLIGGGLGAAFPMLGFGIGKAVPFLRSLVRPRSQASQAVGDALRQSDAAAAAEYRARLQGNPGLSLADVSDPVQQKLQGAVVASPEAREVARTAIREQMERAPGAVANAFDVMAGQTPDTVSLLYAMKDQARRNAAKGFGEALHGARPVNVQPVLDRIDQMIARAVDPDERRYFVSLRRSLLQNGDDPNRLHELQSLWREEVSAFAHSTEGASHRQAGRVAQVRGALVDQIDEASGGTYRTAQRQYASDMAVERAFKDGLDIFRSRSGAAGLEDRPEAWRELFNGMSAAEQDAVRKGARVAMDQIMGSTRNAARRGSEVPQMEFNRAKLEVLFGKDETDRLMAALRDEQAIALKNHRVLGNSETASRQANAAEMGVPNATKMTLGGIGLPGMGAATAALSGGQATIGAGVGAGIAGLVLLANKMARTAATARNKEFARLATARGKEAEEALDRALTRLPDPVRQKVDQLSTLLLQSTTPTLPRWVTGRSF